MKLSSIRVVGKMSTENKIPEIENETSSEKLHQKVDAKISNINLLQKSVSRRFYMGDILKTVKHIIDLDNVIKIMYQPTDAASLGVVRAMFGLCMVLDVVEERGFADVDIKWGDPYKCHFPLVHGMEPLSLAWMIIIYTVMWLGAFGIMLGLYFKIACAFFIFPYWYLFLLDKSYWNNHTYLYGIVSILFWGTDANKYFSSDARRMKEKNETVPFWNYFALKFQFFLLYFLAGLKKGSREWLDGYAMKNLSNHWVFDPFKIFLTSEQIDFYIVHWFGFIFDLTIGFWLHFEKTRFPAMIFCTSFHFMNSRLFSIGMFPYVCLATMFLFCDVSWPRRVKNWCTINLLSMFQNRRFNSTLQKDKIKLESLLYKQKNILNHCVKEKSDCGNLKDQESVNKKELQYIDGELKIKRKNDNGTVCFRKKERKANKRHIFVVVALFCHFIVQILLPYSHFITKGYNNWVPGLYGYSWDMMVHAWDTILVVVQVHDNENNEDHFIDPDAWVQNDRWYKHGDMLKQYAHCLEKNLIKEREELILTRNLQKSSELNNLSSNISIYFDVWCSLNGRIQQRMFNPKIDLLKENWNVFQPISYLMPLLSDLSYYRKKLGDIQRNVYAWSNYTDVLFIADFPNMFLENYIHGDLSNVSLTVLEGSVIYVEEGQNEKVTLTKGLTTNVKTNTFHHVYVTSSYPACYMYAYNNSTEQRLNDVIKKNRRWKHKEVEEKLPLLKEIKFKINAWIRAFSWILDAFLYFVYNVPIARRIKVNNH